MSSIRAGRARGLWYAIGDSPTRAEVDRAAGTYGVVVLNPWERWALRRIKGRNPAVVVLMYQCLSSTRSYAERYPGRQPAGVGFAEAERLDDRWFARDVDGRRIQWAPYPGHWQMAVWDPGYQQRWASAVTQEAVEGGWDGVLADNDFASLRYYSSAVLAGTSGARETDAKIRAGLDGLVAGAGRALNRRGKLFVPNVSEARLHPGRWTAHTRYGGAMEENFVHWGTDPESGFVSDWDGSGWVEQTAQLSGAGLSLAVTRAAPGDHRSLLYGYASVLVRGDENSAWSPSADREGSYAAPQSIPEMSWALGPARTPGTRSAGGTWHRRFDRAFVAVNPTTRSQRVRVPPGFVDGRGRSVTDVRLGATSGLVLVRR